MSAANMLGRVMMINPMLMSGGVVSSLPDALAMSAHLAMAVKMLKRGLEWSQTVASKVVFAWARAWGARMVPKVRWSLSKMS
jgi:hypothetical protein